MIAQAAAMNARATALTLVLLSSAAIAQNPAAIESSHGTDSVPSQVLDQLQAGQPIDAVLATLNNAGHRISYSTAVVKPAMTLQARPRADTIEALLAEILGPWGLAAKREPNGEWLIVRVTSGPAAAANDAQRDADAGLASDTVPLGAVDVTASRFSLADAATPGSTFLTRDEIRAMPHLTDDAVRLLKALPGVAGGDYSAQLNIRGGRRDEVLLRIDGAEIRDAFHIREVSGAISLVDTNLVETMDFVTGGMTADMGNRMSGVIDVRTLRPHPDDEMHSALGVSFINAFLRNHGTFADGRGQWLASARRGYLDLVMRRIQDDDEEFTPRYQDAFARVAFDVTPQTSVAGHFLLGTDELAFLQDNGTRRAAGDGETGTAWVTLDHEWSDTLRTSTMLSSGTTERQRQATDARPEDIVASLIDRADVSFTTLRQDWTWSTHDDQVLRFGFEGQRERTEHEYRRVSAITDPFISGGQPIDTSQTVVVDTDIESWGAYGAYRARWLDQLTTEIGLRSDHYEYADGRKFTRTSPRVNLVFAPRERSELRMAWSVIHQPQSGNELQVEDGVSTFFPPERVEHLVLGYQQGLGSRASLRLDLYRKQYSELRPQFYNLYDPFEVIPEAEADRVRVDAERARVRGAELTFRFSNAGRFDGWLGYAWSRAEEYDGAWRPRFWDQRHTATMALQWHGEKWRASLNGIYHTGWPTTPLSVTEVQQPDGSMRPVPVLGPRNSRQLDSFLRLDLRASRESRLGRGKLTWYLEIYNLLDRENPCCIEDFTVSSLGGGEFSVQPNHDYWLPLLPSFGVQYEF